MERNLGDSVPRSSIHRKIEGWGCRAHATWKTIFLETMMRIALSHPYCWPYVRRGSERAVEELAQYLASRGEDISLISTKPGRALTETVGGYRRILHSQLWCHPLGKLRLQPAHMFLFACLASFSSLEVDVIHSFYYTDACAANISRRWKKHFTVYQVTGPPVPNAFRRIPPERRCLREAIQRADRCAVYSEYTRNVVREYYNVDPEVIPVPIDLSALPFGNGPPDQRPTILSVASFDERRKGLRVLVKAFEIIKHDIRDARLILSGKMSDEVKAEVIGPLPSAFQSDIEVLGVGELRDLPRLYQEASITVLPSMYEAYGMVVVESWASGTPVVVTRHGGFPELVNDPWLGCMFDPMTHGPETMNSEGLAEAIRAGLVLSQQPETRARCRARAAQYTWDILGPKYEKLYEPA